MWRSPGLRRHSRRRAADEAPRRVGHRKHLRHAQVDDHRVRLLPVPRDQVARVGR